MTTRFSLLSSSTRLARFAACWLAILGAKGLVFGEDLKPIAIAEVKHE